LVESRLAELGDGYAGQQECRKESLALRRKVELELKEGGLSAEMSTKIWMSINKNTDILII
jgi:hypothetical protein